MRIQCNANAMRISMRIPLVSGYGMEWNGDGDGDRDRDGMMRLLGSPWWGLLEVCSRLGLRCRREVPEVGRYLGVEEPVNYLSTLLIVIITIIIPFISIPGNYIIL